MIANAQNVALNFDGTDDYVQTSYSGISGNSARTYEAIIRTSANCDPNNGGKQKVIVDYGATSTGGRFTFNVLYNQAIRLEVSGSGMSGQTPVNDGKWHHVAAVYDPNNSKENFKLFVDGVLDTSGNIPTTVSTGSSVNFRIGMRIDNVNQFDGDIDEVRMFNYARTDSAIKADMWKEFCVIPSGMVAYYKLNEGSPGSNNSAKKTASDYSGSSYNGSLTNFNLYGSTSNWISGTTLQGGKNGDTLDILECYEYNSGSGKNYSSPGTYFETFTNRFGCDSVLTINLKLGRSYNIIYPNTCDSFVNPVGRTIYKSGTYSDTLFNANSVKCDSIILTIAKISNSSHTDENVTSCDSANLAGKWYFTDQDVMVKNTLSNGCDSIHTYHLKLNNSSVFSQAMTSCDTFYSALGNTYTTSGKYSDVLKAANQFGCDSAIITDLTINNSFYISQQIESCDSFLSSGNVVYWSSGLYDEFYQTKSGCDSTMHYDLTIHSSKISNDQFTECDSAFVNNNWYFTSQKISYTKPTSFGCDSVITADITVKSVNTSVTLTDEKLEAVQKNGTYQWYDCKTSKDIAGATKDTFTPKYSGEFAVKINYDNCSGISNCTAVKSSGLQNNLLTEIRIFPNPTQGLIQFDLPVSIAEADVVVFDITGREISRFAISGGLTSRQLNLESGNYVLQIQADDVVVLKRLTVE